MTVKTIDDKKLEILKSILALSEDFSKLDNTDEFRQHFPLKGEEWDLKFNKITTDINGQIVLLFIGPFSSGKSSFINAMIGKDILPTNDGPCTAVITEIQFKTSGGHSAVIYQKDGNREDREFSEVIDIINGPTGAAGEVASYHHVVLYLDAKELAQETGVDKGFAQFAGKVCIVDCPGYGSPHYSNEEVIAEYMQQSNFTFWMSPVDKFGGNVAKTYLSEIKRKTQTLIPVITKSDTISDEKEREAIANNFIDELGNLFRIKEPMFTSALKWKEAEKLRKSIEKNREKLTPEKLQEFENKANALIVESGVSNVLGRMFESAGKKQINESKIRAASGEIIDLLKDIKTTAVKESNYWKKQLSQAGVDVDNTDTYHQIEEIQKDMGRWIKENSRLMSDELNTKLKSALEHLIATKNGTPTQMDYANTIETTLSDEWPNVNKKYQKKLKEAYTKFAQGYNISVDEIEKMQLTGLSLADIKLLAEPIKNVLFGFLEAMKSAGVQSTLTAAGGAGLIVASSAISGWEILGVAVGAGLGSVAMIAGLALVGVAALPMIPQIATKIKDFNSRSKEQRENAIWKQLQQGFKEKIQPSLEKSMTEANEKFCDNLIKEIKNATVNKTKNYAECVSIIKLTEEKITLINDNF